MAYWHLKTVSPARLPFHVAVGLLASAVALNFLFSGTAWADCSPAPVTGGTTTCTAGTAQTTTVGTGPGLNNVTVNVNPSAQISTGENTAISLDSNSNITIGSGAVVQNSSSAAGTTGFWGTGQDTIGFNSNNTLTVEAGGQLLSQGSGSANEAVNPVGFGNTIINYGLIRGTSSAAIWFQNTNTGPTANTVDNYGTIQTLVNGGNANVLGVSGSGPVTFINRTGATVIGNFALGGGNDSVTFEAGSVMNGNISGGGGTNSFTLDSVAGSSDTMAGSIGGFQTLLKEGAGQWTLTGNIGNNGTNPALVVTVDQGTLTLTANNANFNGSILVNSAGILEGVVQSLPAVVPITDNGLVRFVQGTNGTYSGVITGSGAFEQAGAGILTLTSAQTYTGATTVTAGTLQAGIANAFAGSNAVNAASGATLDLNNFNQIANNLSGAGSVTLGTAALTVNDSTSTTFSGPISGTGSLVKSGAGTLTLSGTNTYSGLTTISAGTLQIGAGGATGSIAGNIVDNAALVFNRNNAYTYAGAITGTGTLTQAGPGMTILTGAGSSIASTNVAAGTLNLAQAGAFTNSGGYSTASGATTQVAANATLAVGGAFTQAAGSTLNVALGSAQPIISSATANLGGTLNITGVSTSAPNTASALPGTLFNIIHTASVGGISNDFTAVTIGGATSPVDYLTLAAGKSANAQNYDVGFRLTWQAGPAQGNGVFTLASATDAFNVDVVLGNQTGPFASGWDGTTLTKNGAGTLVLSAVNTYTGPTTINAGTLQTGAADTFASSSAVNVASGATLDLNSLNQIANNLSGAGSVTLGSAALTVNDSTSTTFSGLISGTGSLVKSGAGTLTLSGDNTYSGLTTISAGTLQIGAGSTSGSLIGNVANQGALIFNRSDASSYGGVLSGSGSLSKQGGGLLTLSGVGSSQGSVDVQQGTLEFVQAGAFTTTGGYTTASGATTNIGQLSSTLRIGAAFTQAAGATLDVTLGAAPDIVAQSAALSGSLVISGFSESPAPIKASDVINGQLYTMLHTTNGITGNFVNNPLQPSGLDYLLHEGFVSPDGRDYDLGFELAWTQGGAAEGTGTFTLDANTAFNVDIPLANQAVPTGGFASGWDGQSLTKNGDGLLVLSAANTYTGATTINGGILQTGIANTFASSSDVVINGGTLDLAGNNQLANRLAGSGGAILLNGATLTANNAASTDTTTYAGTISDGTTSGGSLVKMGVGALTLVGPLSYTGGTAINGGTLALSGTADLGSSASTSLTESGATLNVSGISGAGANVQNLSGVTGSQLVLAGKSLTVSNSQDTMFAGDIDASSGSLVKNGAGSLTLSGATGYTGTTTLNAGQLILDGSNGGAQLSSHVTGQAGAQLSLLHGASLTGTIDPADVTIDAASIWNMTGNSTVNHLTLAGQVNFAAPPSPFTTGRSLTVTSLVGQGGTISLYTALGNSSSVTDQVLINGGSASGLTHLAIQNADGPGDLTTGNGIPVVHTVNGGTTTTGAFDLTSKVLAGPYEYTLQRGGTGAANDWFLVNNAPTSEGILPDYRAETSLYSVLSGEALRYGEAVLGTFRERMGAMGEVGASNDRYVWGRTIGQSDRDDGANNGIYGNDVRNHGGLAALQVGGDLYVTSDGSRRTSAGVYGAIGESRSTVDHIDTFGVTALAGNNTLKAYSLGAYATWLDGKGGYLDAVLQGTHYDVSSQSVNNLRLSTSSNGVAGSLEAGKRFELQPGLGLEPQAQVVYQSVGTSNSRDQVSAFSFDRANSALLRVGARLTKALDTDGQTPSSAWLTLNVLHNTGGGARTNFATDTQGEVSFANNYPGTRLGLQAGIDARVAKNILFNVRFGAERSIDGGHLTSYAGQFGVKVIL